MMAKSFRRLSPATVLSIACLGILTACIHDFSGMTTAAQSQLEASTRSADNQQHMVVNVKRQAGECPQTIKIWTLYLPIEGAVEHTAVPDIRPIAGPPRLVSSSKKIVEYEAPLNPYYTSCIGDAHSQEPDVYLFQFRNGKVYFRLDLNKATAITEITYQGIGGLRPYVRWTAGD